jgi:hypothetical protein
MWLDYLLLSRKAVKLISRHTSRACDPFLSDPCHCRNPEKKRATQRVALNGQQLSVIYGTSWLIRVAQFARLLRVPPQVKPPPETRYCVSVQFWPMYSLAIHKIEPSLTAAP